MRVLFLSAEVVPFAKTGGLGDVGSALPQALRKLGHDVRVVMPAYQPIETGTSGVEPLPLQLNVPMSGTQMAAGVFTGNLPGSDVPIYFIARQDLFNRPRIYGYWDDVYRFSFFSRAAIELADAIDWIPDVVHGHDWHAAPAITWIATAGRGDARYRDVATVFTIHNLAHQGQASWDIFGHLGIPAVSLYEEPYGQLNFMARGIYHADLVNTVSPTYAREILTPAGGAGLDGLLRHRQGRLHGILNGLDYSVWNPLEDHHLAQVFDPDSAAERIKNKLALQKRAGLVQDETIALAAMVTRLDRQKGLDITGSVIQHLVSGGFGPAQFVVLGTGDPQYEQMFAQLAEWHPGRMSAFLSYNADLAHLIYAGSDQFLMPSLFEPCGLGQLIAMNYGSVPVVRATGGLADTVHDFVNGFSFAEYSSGAFARGLQRALSIYYDDEKLWREIQKNGMLSDFSWERSAEAYQQLYEWAVASI